MSVLTLVRHGQASLFADDYDQLSPLGEEQGRLLGRFWGERGVTIDAVYSGPRRRQRASAEAAGAAYAESGLAWPEPVVLEPLDEYDLDGLMTSFAPKLAAENGEFARLVEAYRSSAGEPHRIRIFQRMFEALIQHWQAAGPHAGVESWPDFQQRVADVIRQIQQTCGRGQRLVVFTSGGFISCAMQRALGVSDAAARELNWRIRNSSLTEFVFTPERFTLDAFNMIPHLPEPRLWTYR